MLYIGLGSNLGDRITNLAIARKECALALGPILKRSSIYLSEPWGIKDQAAFLNQVVLIQTNKSAPGILENIKQIEKQMGRTEGEKWGPRLIDIDILFLDNHIVNKKGLEIPHPEIQSRSFVLLPMNDINPTLVHPVLKRSIKDLLSTCEDDGKVVPSEEY